MIPSLNTKEQVKKLNDAFHHVTRSMGKNNVKGTTLYQYQVDFAYLLDNIERGPTFQIPFLIYQAENLIRTIAATNNSNQKS